MYVVKVLMLTATKEEHAKGTDLRLFLLKLMRESQAAHNKYITTSPAMASLIKMKEVISKPRSPKERVIFWLPVHKWKCSSSFCAR